MQKRLLFIACLLLAVCNKIAAEDQITISDISMSGGQSKEVGIVLTNDDAYVGFQFDLYLPEGFTVESYSADPARMPSETSLRMAQQTDGSYRFVAAALSQSPITGNSGTIVNVMLKADDSVAEGNHQGFLRGVKLSKADGTGITIAEQPFAISVHGDEPYAVLTENNTILTFYYDKQKEERGGMSVGPFTGYNQAGWTAVKGNITNVVFDASFADCLPTSTAFWFDGFYSLTSIQGMGYLKTDSVTNMNSMFEDCSSLQTVDLSGFNTEKVTDMNHMFWHCLSLTEVNLSGVNTTRVTDMNSMFMHCGALTSIGVSSFNTANVTNMSTMFSGCSKLTTLDLTNFNTIGVVNTIEMFRNCSELMTVIVGNEWTMANVESGVNMFSGCPALVGGMGTVYDANHVDADYAHIDGGTQNPGYLTPKNGYGAAAVPTFTRINNNKVLVSSETEGAVIRYTLDGTEPGSTSTVYGDSIGVDRNLTIKAYAARQNFTDSEVATYVVDWFKVSDVEFIQNGNQVALSTATPDATIHYTLSTEAVTGEHDYDGTPLTMSGDCFITAWATRDGYTTSDQTNFEFHAGGVTCSNPVFARNGNVITLATATEQAQIFYTTDGTEPTVQSLLYADSILADRNMVIKAIAVRENYYPSQVISFTVDWFKADMPTFQWTNDQLSLSTATEGGDIYYTNDADAPTASAPQLYSGAITVTQDAVITAWTQRQGWNNSDTLVIDYPYTAWVALLDAVNAAKDVIAQATGNDNVPQQMLNELQALVGEAEAMYQTRTAARTDVEDVTERLNDLAAAVNQLATAINEPYAVLSQDGLRVTFYYDKKKAERGGIDINNDFVHDSTKPLYGTATAAVFDASFDVYRPTSTAFWFQGCSSLVAISGIEYLHTDDVTDMSYMFAGCPGLTSLDLSNFNTANVTDMSYMFAGCNGLASLVVSNFNTTNVTDMSYMFAAFYNQIILDLSNFNTANVTSMEGMFSGSHGLTSVNVTNFNTSNVTNMRDMFNDCSSLESVDFTNFNTDNLENTIYMFYNCSSLKSIYAGGGWNAGNISESEGMFLGCTALVGGMGTVYDPSHIDAAYAHIDGGTANPGYFTAKDGLADPLLARLYDNLALTTTDGNADGGNNDLSGSIDAAQTSLVRAMWNLQELPTDESYCVWMDPGIPALNTNTWSDSTQTQSMMGLYARLYHGIALANNYLANQNDGDMGKQAEARFLRALQYYYLMDHFGNVPLLTDTIDRQPLPVWEATPSDIELLTREEMFSYIENELQESLNSLPATNSYGRATATAARLLLARLYLNSEVYTGTARWQEARSYAESVINGGTFQLAPIYRNLFMGDNDSNGAQQEIILPAIYDGNTRTDYGGTTFLVASSFANGEGDNGTTQVWAGNVSKPDFVNKFFTQTADIPYASPEQTASAAGDDRALFYGINHSYELRNGDSFSDGFPYQKFTNVRSNGTSPVSSKFADTDFPLMRLGEAYLIAAEADARLNGSATSMQGTQYINMLRNRANATTSTAGYSLSDICDEWSREMGYEAVRRTTLIRFGRFGGQADYSWAWKGGSYDGTAFDAGMNTYPIPAAEVGSTPEPYAVLSADSLTVTFCYDGQKAARGGMDIRNSDFSNSSYSSAKTAEFDASFANYLPTSTAFWFSNCSSLTAISGIENLKTENVTSMWRMFDGCSSLTSLDLSGFNTANVTDMSCMFIGCSGLTSLDLSSFNTANVIRLDSMFFACGSMTSLDLTEFKTENVTSMTEMFYGCSGLTTIYVGENWSTAAVTEGNGMFSGCAALVGGAGTVYDANHTDYTYAHIDGGTANPGYFTDKNATPVQYAFDAETGVLTVGGETPMADALEATGGRAEVAKGITAVVWQNTTPLTDNDLQGLDNPNMLVYVAADTLAPKNRDNVVVGDFAKNIVLTDVSEGNGSFYCPQEFKAEMITYTRNFQQQTQVGVSRGWETIALPFTVQTIVNERNGVIAPFGSSASDKHFWLRQLTQTGMTAAQQIEANMPYLISMPNSEEYDAEFNQNGHVTFSSQDVVVPVTTLRETFFIDNVNGGEIVMMPTMMGLPQAPDYYALNVGQPLTGYEEGSVFVLNSRDIRPFEAYTMHHGNLPAPQYLSVAGMTGDSDALGIEELRGESSDVSGDRWYDLNGRRLQGRPAAKGVYILNGRKTVVK